MKWPRAMARPVQRPVVRRFDVQLFLVLRGDADAAHRMASLHASAALGALPHGPQQCGQATGSGAR